MFLKKTVDNFLFGFTPHHAHYIFIRVTNDLMYYREGGRQCCFMSLSALLFDKLGSSTCCHWTAENVDHILEFGDKMSLDSLQEGLIPDTETFSISNLPQFAVHWIAESSKAVDLPRHWGQFYREINPKNLAKSANFAAKLTLKIPRNLSFFREIWEKGLKLEAVLI